MRDRSLEIQRIRKTVSSDETKLGKLPVGAIYLVNVYTTSLLVSSKNAPLEERY